MVAVNIITKNFLAFTSKMKLRNNMCEHAWQKGMAKRLNGGIKNNYLKHRTIQNFKELAKEVDRLVLLCNNDKPHRVEKKKHRIRLKKNRYLI